MKHQIRISFDHPKLVSLGLARHLRRCICEALRLEGVDVPCEISVLITDDQGIRAINRGSRETDLATDVLSFPMFTVTPGQFPADVASMLDPGTGLLPLGDMAISLERAKAQATEYGHSVARETGYLTIHSVLHLLGYDHLDEGPMKTQMRGREEAILAEIDLPRA